MRICTQPPPWRCAFLTAPVSLATVEVRCTPAGIRVANGLRGGMLSAYGQFTQTLPAPAMPDASRALV
jgi:hypothetical protein